MSLKQQTKEQYEAIRQSVMNDPELKDDTERLQQFSNTYKDIILAEPAIMEWEFDHWERQTVGEGLIGLFITVLAGVLAAFSPDFLVVAVGLGLLMLFINAMLTYPIRFKHKLTESGVYIYRYKRGKKIRQFLAALLLLITVVAGIVSTFYMGLMAFAGAGAGMLGIFTFYALIQKQDKVKEVAQPWEGIFIVTANLTNSILRKDRNFVLHYVEVKCTVKNYEDVKCTVKNYEDVKEAIKSHVRQDAFYKEGGVPFDFDKRNEVVNKLHVEQPFYEGDLYY